MRDTRNMVSFLWIFFATFLASALLPNTPLQLLPASAGTNDTSIITTDNDTLLLSAPTTSLTPANLPSYLCDDAFGSELNRTSCDLAIRSIDLRSTRPLSFGMRSSRGPHFDVGLPRRWISSDGKCAVEPALSPDATKARASLEDVAVAAFVIMKNCIDRREPSWGGLARMIGGDNNLRVILSQYDPSNVRCYGRMSKPDSLASCQEILDQMPAFNTPFEFGPSTDEGADVQLPKLMTSRDQKCKITIRTTGKGDGNTDVYSWGRFWEVAVALVGVCVAAGKEGVETRLGENGYLYMEVGPP